MPIRFELDVEIDDRSFQYKLALELPEDFNEMRVAEEMLFHDGSLVFERKTGQVTLSTSTSHEARFIVDWHLVALPVIQVQSETDPIHVFKT